MVTDPALITGRLNVDDYVAARKADIECLENLLDGSGSGARKRAFQSLPRVERRRVASHHPKRVPRKSRLRELAQLESVRDNSFKPKRRTRVVEIDKTKIPPVRDCTYADNEADNTYSVTGKRYADRQRSKVWLPTHVWHKKRAFLDEIAGIMIPRTATQKQYRRTYRMMSHLDEHGAIAWDTSYYSTFIASGDLLKTMEMHFPKCTQPLYMNGTKHWQGNAASGSPAIVHWINGESAAIQCHPLAFDEVWGSLCQRNLKLQDCRYSIGSFDILGTQAMDNLLRILIPAKSVSPSTVHKWRLLCSLGPALPSRAAFHLTLNDPRIPHKYIRPAKLREALLDPVDADIPLDLNRSELDNVGKSVYSREDREKSLAFIPQKHNDWRTYSANQRRPAEIPTLILQLDDGRVRVLLPKDWVLPFWLCLFKRCNSVEIGGQLELQQLALDKLRPFYPRDFPNTTAGREFHEQWALHKKEAYFKKPAAKRPPIKCTVGDPFKLADLNMLSSSLCHVSIEAVKRGVPAEGARIFDLDDVERLGTQGRTVDGEQFQLKELIGFVTSASYGLVNARGRGVGICKRGLGLPRLCFIQNVGDSEGFAALLTSVTEGAVS